jgi:hypothetical protein
MPQGFYGRRGDNWRPLVAVADACSPAWGALIREAMVHFTRGYQDKHILVLLLEHNRRGSSYDRMGKHGPSEQSGYAPMALSSIGPLPRPQMSRCIEFYLVRANEERSKLLRRFDVNDTADLDRTYQITRAWLQTAKIAMYSTRTASTRATARLCSAKFWLTNSTRVRMGRGQNGLGSSTINDRAS